MNPGGRCELDENKICDGCNECNRCDLDPTKLCDSCGKCLELDDAEYKEVFIEGVLSSEDEADEYLGDSDSQPDDDTELKEDFEDGVEYIEDIPELKEKYDKQLQDIFKEMGKDNNNQ
jgi:hypothetical protein